MALIAITGGAGFIGFHLQKMLESKHATAAIDVLHPSNKAAHARAALLKHIHVNNIHSAFIDEMNRKPDIVIHLAAETGIAGSLSNPSTYFDTNVSGTFNVLEQCRKNGVKYLIYASSSSVYSPAAEMKETSCTDRQLSFYGTTKKMSEVMIENYCKQFGLTAIGLRFFTVYGSYTRPDMAAYKFMQAIDAGKNITLYNNGNTSRDFTHVKDVVRAIDLLVDRIITEPEGFHEIFNIGYGSPVSVKTYATYIAAALQKELLFNIAKLPANELEATHSNTLKLFDYIGFKPEVNTEEGVKEMVNWFKTGRYE